MPRQVHVRSALLVFMLVASGCGSAAGPAGGTSSTGGAGGTSAAAGTGGTSSPGNAGGSPGNADAGIDAPAPAGPCGGLTCNMPPANACEGDTLRTYYDPNGTCVAAACSYRSTTQICPHGCQGDHCSSDTGHDAAPAIDAAPTIDAAPAIDAAPGGGACPQTPCSTPPANSCDGSMLKTYYDPNGTCSAGVCSYKFSVQNCPRGCMDGHCITVTCTPGSATFTADVTDIDSLATVGPLPALAGGAGYEIRSYMQVKDSYAGVRVPIYAPTKMTLLASVHYSDPLHDPSDTDYHGEWGLVFEASCTTQVTFAHVREVETKISDATVPSDAGTGELVSHPVDFAAGEVIGHYIRGPGYFAWELVVNDTTVTNTFSNMQRYQDGQLKFLHAVCPYDPYPPQMRQRYLELLGTNNDPPKAGRKCGTVSHDHAGSVAGVWFHAPYSGGTADQARAASGNPLSIFKAETDVVFIADLDGDTNKVGFATFRIEPGNPSYLDPESIADSHCFERHVSPTDPGSGWAWVKRLSDTQLQVAYGLQGPCPVAFPTTGVRDYYR
jgi:hypothetical protein